VVAETISFSGADPTRSITLRIASSDIGAAPGWFDPCGAVSRITSSREVSRRTTAKPVPGMWVTESSTASCEPNAPSSRVE